MKKLISLFVIGTLLAFAGCKSVQPSNLTPAFVGAQTTLLVQGAELAAKTPADAAAIKTAAVAAGQVLNTVAVGTVVITPSALQPYLVQALVAKGVDPVKAVAISKIVVAEYNLVASQFGFAGNVVVNVNVAAVQPYVAAIANALLNA